MIFRLRVQLFCILLGSVMPGLAHSVPISEIDSIFPSLFSAGSERMDSTTPNDPSAAALSSWSDQTDEATRQKADGAVWQHGPALIRLNDTASIALPPGFRYLSRDQVAQLQQHGKEVTNVAEIDAPFSLIGPDDGSWTAQLIAIRQGYVPTSELRGDASGFDFEQLRVALQDSENRKVPTYIVPQVEWIDDPLWDESGHRLYWSYRVSQLVDRIALSTTIGAPASRAMSGLEQKTYYNSLALGRRTVVWLRAAGIDEKAVHIDLERALRARFREQFDGLRKGIRFDSDESYADHRAGDKRSKFGLSEIVSGEALRPQPGLLDRMGWLASPRMLFGYAMLLMLLMRLPWSRTTK